MMQPRCRCMFALFLGLLPMAAAVGTAGPDNTKPSAADNPLAAQRLDDLSATRDRPLFSRSRRPPPPPPPVVERVAPPPPPVAPPSVVLLGVVKDENGALALVRSGSANEVIRARVGEEIEAWKVTEIEPRRLVLSHDDRLVSFALFANQKGNDFPLFTNPKGKDTVVRKPPAGPGQTVPTAGPGQTMRQRRAAVVFQ